MPMTPAQTQKAIAWVKQHARGCPTCGPMADMDMDENVLFLPRLTFSPGQKPTVDVCNGIAVLVVCCKQCASVRLISAVRSGVTA